MRWVRALLVAFCALLLGPVPGALADCTNPAAPEGVMLYNTNANVPQYCDGTAWTRLAPPAIGLPVDGSLVGWWKLDESSGNATDSSGNDFTGTIIGNPVWQPSGGKIAGALDFDGAGDYVSVTSPNFNFTAYTWCHWINSDAPPDTGARKATFASSTGDSWGFLHGSNSGVDRQSAYHRLSGGGYVDVPITGVSPLKGGVWYHICATWDGANVRAYLNGSLDNTQAAATVIAQSGNLTIGSYGSSQYFPGIIDDVRIYNRALSAEEIARCCAAMPGMGEGPSGLSIAGSVTNAQLDGAGAIAMRGNYAYVTAFNADRLTVVNISNPAAPAIVGSVQHATQMNGPSDVKRAGNYAYLSLHAGDGFSVVDISNAAAPVIVGSITDTRLDGANMVALSGNYAYVPAEFSNRLNVIDISNPAAPVIVGSVQHATQLNRVQTVALSGSYAYATSWGDDRLTVVDISNPSTPSIVTSLQDAQLDGAFPVILKGNYAYVVASLNNRLTVVDISNPSSPSIVTSVQDAKLGNSWGMAMQGDYLYVEARTTDGLTVVDISNPAAPVVGANMVDATNIDDPRGLEISGGYAFITAINSDRLNVIRLNWNCNAPPGIEGELHYNLDTRTPMYCDGRQWVALGQDWLSNGLAGHWKLDETSGTLKDSSGNGNNGTQSGGVGYSSAGMVGTAVNFDGVNDYVDMGNPATLNNITNALTISAWIKTTAPSPHHTIFNKYGFVAKKGYLFWIWTQGATQKLMLEVGDGADANIRASTSSTPIKDNNWHMVTGVMDGTKPIKLYVDGAEASYIEQENGATISLPAGIPAKIGERSYIGEGASRFVGPIDDVRVYNRALSAAEVTALYDYGLLDDGLIAHWPLNEDGGIIANDMAGGNIGYASGGVTFSSTGGQIKGAAEFDGVDDYFNIADDDPFDVGTGDFTVSMWVKTIQAPALDKWPNPVSKMNVNSTIGYGIALHDSNTSSTWLFEAADGTWYGVPGASDVADGQWHHLVGVRQGATLYAYEDGTLANSGPGPADSVDHAFSLTFGQHPSLDSCCRYNGAIDDVRIYNRALSAEEIAEIHAAGAAGRAAQDCVNPNAAEGVIIYNLNENAPQYCDGARWVRMGGP